MIVESLLRGHLCVFWFAAFHHITNVCWHRKLANFCLIIIQQKCLNVIMMHSVQIDQGNARLGGLVVTGWGGLPTPYDTLIATNEQGTNDGIVQRVQFIFAADTDLDASFLNGTSWWVRHPRVLVGVCQCSTAWYLLH